MINATQKDELTPLEATVILANQLTHTLERLVSYDRDFTSCYQAVARGEIGTPTTLMDPGSASNTHRGSVSPNQIKEVKV